MAYKVVQLVYWASFVPAQLRGPAQRIVIATLIRARVCDFGSFLRTRLAGGQCVLGNIVCLLL